MLNSRDPAYFQKSEKAIELKLFLGQAENFSALLQM